MNLIGETRFDLGQATVSGPDATITVVSLIGGTRIRVPEGIDVEVTGGSLLGSHSVNIDQRVTSASAPKVRIRGLSLIGDFRVTHQ